MSLLRSEPGSSLIAQRLNVVAHSMDWDLERQVYPTVRWLVYHRRAKIVDTVHRGLRTVFVLSSKIDRPYVFIHVARLIINLFGLTPSFILFIWYITLHPHCCSVCYIHCCYPCFSDIPCTLMTCWKLRRTLSLATSYLSMTSRSRSGIYHDYGPTSTCPE